MSAFWSVFAICFPYAITFTAFVSLAVAFCRSDDEESTR